jgi:hypothetical protein
MTLQNYTVLFPVNFNGTLYAQGATLNADDADPNIVELLTQADSAGNPVIILASDPAAAGDLTADTADSAQQAKGPGEMYPQEPGT